VQAAPGLPEGSAHTDCRSCLEVDCQVEKSTAVLLAGNGGTLVQSEWTDFQSTLTSNDNTWWDAFRSIAPWERPFCNRISWILRPTDMDDLAST